jgi:hypothetical protein
MLITIKRRMVAPQRNKENETIGGRNTMNLFNPGGGSSYIMYTQAYGWNGASF